MDSDTCPQLFEGHPGVEAIAYYRKGGFHPIHINDIMQDRYRVVNKLGHGTYGTVWLVEDLKSGKCAALKVLAAEISKDVSELDIHRHLKRRNLANPDGAPDGREFVLELLDDFTVEGPNGTHQCIVTEVLGPRINTDPDDFYDATWYPIGITKRLVAQVARGVAYLHSCGVVHGDLHAGNVLFQIPGVERMSSHNFAKYLEENII